jgi:hypothetical protein
LDGDTVAEKFTVCTAIVFGLPGFGNVPTAWFGKPLAVKERAVALQLHCQFEVSVPAAPKVPVYVPAFVHNTLAVLVPDATIGVTDTAAEAELLPTELLAVTEQLYVTPLVRPVTMIGLDAPVATNEPDAVQVAV